MVLSNTGISFPVQGRHCGEGLLFTWEANIPIAELGGGPRTVQVVKTAPKDELICGLSTRML